MAREGKDKHRGDDGGLTLSGTKLQLYEQFCRMKEQSPSESQVKQRFVLADYNGTLGGTMAGVTLKGVSGAS